MRAQEAADRFPLPRVAGCFELLSYLTQQMEDEHTDKNMPIHAVFKLVVIWAQSERALDEGKAVLRLEQRQVKRPELWGIERLIGLEHLVATGIESPPFDPSRVRAFAQSRLFQIPSHTWRGCPE